MKPNGRMLTFGGVFLTFVVCVLAWQLIALRARNDAAPYGVDVVTGAALVIPDRSPNWGLFAVLAATLALLAGWVYLLGFRRTATELTSKNVALEEATTQWRTSQALARGIIEATNDSIVAMDEHGRITEFNRAAELTFGYSRAQALGQTVADLLVPAAARAGHLHGLARYLATGESVVLGKRIEVTALRADGSEFPAELTVTPVRLGNSQLFTASIRDITSRVRAEERRQAEYAITRVLAESATLEEAIPNIIAAACESLGWDLGALWVVDQNFSTLRCNTIWHVPSMNADDLIAECRQVTFAPGVGLPGRVWASGEPTWVVDVTADSQFPRRAVPDSDKIRSAFAWPVRSGNQILAVLEFQSRKSRPQDDDVIRMLDAVGAQVGQFIGRKRTEESLTERARFAALTCEISLALTRRQPLNDLLRLCTEILVRCLDGAFARLWTLTDGTDVLELQASEFADANPDGSHRRIQIGKCKIGLIAQVRKAHLTNSVQNDPLVDREWAEREKIVAFAGFPLIVEDRLVGVLALFSRKPFSELAFESLAAVADTIALGIERKRTEDQLRSARELLEQRVEERTQELAVANNALKAEIVERQRAEVALWVAHDELEERVRGRTQDLVRQTLLLQSILNSMNEGLVVVDQTGRMTIFNSAAERIVGKGLTDLPSAEWPKHYGVYRTDGVTPYPSEELPIARALRGERSHDEELVLRPPHRDGLVWVSTTSAAIHDPDGNLLGALTNFRDVTAVKREQEALQQAKKAAEAANLAKSEFLANMSHEIRTPMNGIIGMTELALDTELTHEQREYLDIVKKSADALLNVINDILDFSKIEAGKLRLESMEFRLRDHLADVVKPFARRATEAGLELTCHVTSEVPDVLIGDPLRLRQIIVNLVGNAIKFTAHGEVGVRVERIVQDDRFPLIPPSTSLLHFTVSDSGIGIPANKQDSIFHAFEQVDSSSTRKYGGTGLGLAISSELVAMMGGRMWVDSKVGVGSVFHFVLPFEARSEPSAGTMGEVPIRLRGLSALIVDDNATNRRLLQDLLTQWGMNAIVVDNGHAALTALHEAAERHEPFGLVILDAMMPDMDGFTVAESIKRSPDLAKATLMMLSSTDLPRDSARCRELALDGYLTKPVTQTALLEAIVKALRISWQRQQGVTRPISFQTTGRLLRVLVAEDHPVNQRLLVRLLEKQDHHATLASNGREAVELFTTHEFDLIMMDVQMPEMGGIEASTRIRALEAARSGSSTQRVPIIAITAHAMKGDRERCLSAGMDGYITKPIHAADLFREIDAVLDTPTNKVETVHTSESRAVGPTENRSEEVIDIPALLDRVDGDRGLLRELVDLYLADVPGRLRELSDAVEARDLPRLAKAAHAIKGAVGNFCAREAQPEARELERLARNGDLAAASAVYARLVQALSRLEPELIQLVGSAPLEEGARA